MRYFVLYNDNVLLLEYGPGNYLYSIPRACLTSSYRICKNKFCSNGKFLYRSNNKNSLINIYNLNTFDIVVKECFVTEMVAVENGVILLTAKNIPELWNNKLTKLVYSFDELKGTNKIFEVSDVSFACQKTESFVFFNVKNKRKEISVNFENYRTVHVFACSSKYHVFAKVEFKDQIIYCMWHEDKLVNGWDDVIKEEIAKVIGKRMPDITLGIKYAAFSPSADKLLIGEPELYVKVFDIRNLQIIFSFTKNLGNVKFFFLDYRFIINKDFEVIDLKYFKSMKLLWPCEMMSLTDFYFCRKRKLVFTFSLDVPAHSAKIILPRE
ncbi:uncharacterized protein LOC124447228 [Xenia sp. Carnegie-2017]|uniref:uncharacterized protein LOC124447228 n=1 Tax=Xenia sp. Carnegie-2017 TaxID=2897299 RepID=UPI001F047645|nr:uncharacterized protein LOC124447228 [Xenia sp. Carnegie-2017]XP_046854074.1 uncharacterized protein LOC124447228 [Xenia sp. Carnegie-2017]XP_046854075.1 uncharacterized protein LOC124447228 [Xenia sp. Carnegie-2017]XP_046854076.1 uncharacterized protein LOC124447228 [Xenia sp. Carnegie-2017]XP_046854077.1 uncharacterized protein LOC124447228 [Xenia sp. Carnegie-2017]XP_046854078.1 uncharacterized protein LOC124447228 [Xenia sp. Carnegie-2017]